MHEHEAEQVYIFPSGAKEKLGIVYSMKRTHIFTAWSDMGRRQII